MSVELGILPSGHLHCFFEQAAQTDPQNTKALSKAFSTHLGEGLFVLSVYNDETELASSVRFWRELSCLYMKERCHTPSFSSENLEPISIIPEINELLQNAPPMKGAEYLSSEALEMAWETLDGWVCEQANNMEDKFNTFLKKRAPKWRQVGRVCFHLAENKDDPEHPFAFIATYAPQLSTQGKTHHKPLGTALQEYAGAGNKKALINLLAPVSHASESCDLIKDLVDSGDIYHPLAWDVAESYQFLQNVSLYEF